MDDSGERPGHIDEPGTLLERLEERADPGSLPLIKDFAKAMLRRSRDLELDRMDPDALAGKIVAAFDFVADRHPGDLALRTFNPDVSLDGWSDPGTVIEVCTEDRPFLLTTVVEELRRLGHEVVRTIHPVLGVERDDDGTLEHIGPARGAASREALVHVELDARVPHEEQGTLEKCLRDVLQDVIAATRDFQKMRERVEDVTAVMRRRIADGVLDDDASEAAELLDWLLDDNFVLLGCRDYELTDRADDEPAVEVVAGSGLGILGDVSRSRYSEPVPLSEADDHFRARLDSERVVSVARSHRYSTVRKRVRMVNVWAKRVDEQGHPVGQFRLLGLFADKTQPLAAASIPVLRRKLDRVLELEDVAENSHDERTFLALFQAMPKDELFELDLPELRATLLELFAAEGERDIAVHRRVDPITRNVSVIVSLPRDHYDADFRRRVQELLRDRYGIDAVEVDLSLGDRPEAIARFSLRLPEGDIPEVSPEELEADVRRLARTWEDEVTEALVSRHGEAEGRRLAREVGSRMPATYREHATIDLGAPDDVEAVDALLRSDQELHIRLHDDPHPGAELTRLKMVKLGPGIELSRMLPILESLGLTVAEELPFRLTGDGPEIHVHDYGVHVDGSLVDVERDGQRIADTVLAAWDGRLEVDSLNRLILQAQLDWAAVTLLRAYRRYRRQVGTAYTADYTNDALVEHRDVTRALVRYFEVRFDPELDAPPEDVDAARQDVLAALEAVERLDHDRILRHFLAMVDATLRTNRYRPDAGSHLTLKFDSAGVPAAPKPVPHRELFVYTPEVEGIHLRGGPVARGGIRWSDRRDDFRAEVLGLMQAQLLKNAMIVPTGGKGGFVLKRPPLDPDALDAEVARQYRTFIRALLEITDNVVGGEVTPPSGVRRADGDDPYLVVAADRGTAAFSDVANSIADELGFWLGDAFAAGGSCGYDHKQLGITARGVWVAVQRHFRELGVDVQTEPITVVGIGDMSGDVFGNGMLQSRSIELVAAFDHRDIFLDPQPDAERAFAERKRLFEQPHLSWKDYDREAISDGGGVWSRHEKSVPLSPQVREVLRIEQDQLAPPELIRAILRAPVDLLFAGGIGTFVKASYETNEGIGDRTNDEVRIDATQLGARVVGEGANLAVTQEGRIQYARRGGRINADFIDNAAAVDISDREVNLKVLLGLAVERDEISADERDSLLEDVTDDVVASCLNDVDLQAWMLSQEAAASPANIEVFEALLAHLESTGAVERAVEALPSSEQMQERREAGAGLTRPELAVLLAASKRDVSQILVDSDLPDQPALSAVLRAYFPPRLVERFSHLLAEHRLRRELIATVVANDVVNRAGIAFVHRLTRDLGLPHATVVAAYWVARAVIGAERYWETIEDLDQHSDPDLAEELKREVDAVLETLTREYARSRQLDDIAATIEQDRGAVEELERAMVEARLPGSDRRQVGRAQQLVSRGVDALMAARLESLADLEIAPDVAAVARTVERDVAGVAEAFLVIGEALGLPRLQRLLERVRPADRWARMERRGLADDLRAVQREAAHRALLAYPEVEEGEAADRFVASRRTAIQHAARLARVVDEDQDQVRLDAVSVALRAIRDALRSGAPRVPDR
ncbi:MAG TPA: NAD-glutamate dehydrogenase domain-containing protein [Nitriliruptorales bacterium]|nr:NAD-glutamate dehydrogenase domain-containing protein [Nitriliruptorales bacterium]